MGSVLPVSPSIAFEEEPLEGQAVQNSLDAPPTFSALIAGPQGQHPRFVPSLVQESPQPRQTEPLTRAQPKVDGRAYGADYVGAFEHHTGTLGPFGFYANFYDEK